MAKEKRKKNKLVERSVFVFFFGFPEKLLHKVKAPCVQARVTLCCERCHLVAAPVCEWFDSQDKAKLKNTRSLKGVLAHVIRTSLFLVTFSAARDSSRTQGTSPSELTAVSVGLKAAL